MKEIEEKKATDKAAEPEIPEAQEVPEETISTQKTVRYVDTRSNAVDLDVQLAKEKAEELAPEIKDTEMNKQRIKKNKKADVMVMMKHSLK
jgi:hypothetical protein